MGNRNSNHFIQVNDPLFCCLFHMNQSVPSKIVLSYFYKQLHMYLKKLGRR
jgi:hypothetical protein